MCAAPFPTARRILFNFRHTVQIKSRVKRVLCVTIAVVATLRYALFYELLRSLLLLLKYKSMVAARGEAVAPFSSII